MVEFPRKYLFILKQLPCVILPFCDFSDTKIRTLKLKKKKLKNILYFRIYVKVVPTEIEIFLFRCHSTLMAVNKSICGVTTFIIFRKQVLFAKSFVFLWPDMQRCWEGILVQSVPKPQKKIIYLKVKVKGCY